MSNVVASGAKPDLVQQCLLQRTKRRRKRKQRQAGFHFFYEVTYMMALVDSVHTCKHSTITFSSL